MLAALQDNKPWIIVAPVTSLLKKTLPKRGLESVQDWVVAGEDIDRELLLQRLTEGGYLDTSRRTTDAWDSAFVIDCEGDDVIVTSPGPDGELGNEDDIQ